MALTTLDQTAVAPGRLRNKLTRAEWGRVGLMSACVLALYVAGFVLVGLFVAVWVLSLGIWRSGQVEARWEDAAARARAARALDAQ
jgi:hypothetical protein